MDNQLLLEFKTIDDQSIESCANCLCSMNKAMPDFAFCFENNRSIVDLNDHCNQWERNR